MKARPEVGSKWVEKNAGHEVVVIAVSEFTTLRGTKSWSALCEYPNLVLSLKPFRVWLIQTRFCRELRPA